MINVGYAFPLEKLGADIARNDYNYQSILNGLINWNSTTQDEVIIRLTKDTDPYYQDYIIPSKKAVFNNTPFQCQVSGVIQQNSFSVDCGLSVAVFGGTRIFYNSIFDANTNVNITTNEITLSSVQNLYVNDIVKFTVLSGAILPTGILATQSYIVSLISGTSITLSYMTGGVVDITATGVGNIALTARAPLSAPPIDPTDPGDVVTIRTSVQNNGTCAWQLYYGATINDWIANQDYYYGNLVLFNGVIYFTVFDVFNSTVTPDLDHANYILYVNNWQANVLYPIDSMVSYNGSLYQVIGDTTITQSVPSLTNDAYMLYANAWIPNAPYNKGNFIACNNIAYLALNNQQNSVATPDTNTDDWMIAFPFIAPMTRPVISSTTFRWYANQNASNFWLKNVTTNTSSTDATSIFLSASLQYKQTPSAYGRSVALFPTSNYTYWPESDNSMWQSGVVYGPTNPNISVTSRQNYSATMVFNHANPAVTKTINFINYDGPDLDQGLCIYLPVEVSINESEIVYPEDGFTFEFFIRIWPNAAYTQSVTRDHIINKAQVYVYSATDIDAIPNNNCSTPIAKFSMARTTNFYMFGENVTIPDKPVCYRATFVYSAAQQKWITFDYYQLPDHVFIGPVGWIDPQNPANLDINADVGSNNPNPNFIGYETAGFPLFQDPFSNTDLTPFKISDPVQREAFSNRIM